MNKNELGFEFVFSKRFSTYAKQEIKNENHVFSETQSEIRHFEVEEAF